MGFGSILKEILADKNMSIKELSQITGIPLNTLYSITKRDTVNVRQETLEKISQALNVPTDDFINALHKDIKVKEHELQCLRARLEEAQYKRSREMELRKQLSKILSQLTHYEFNNDEIDTLIATAILLKEPPATE